MGELFDVLAFLADQGPDRLSWNKEVDNLLFWSLLLEEKKTKNPDVSVHVHETLPLTGARKAELHFE